MKGIQGRFLTGSTMSHVLRMTLTGTAGITFVFLVDAINLFWISWLGDIQLMAAMGFGFSIQFFSVSVGIGLMIASTALISRSIGQGKLDQTRDQATSVIIIAVFLMIIVTILMIIYRKNLVGFLGANGDTAEFATRYLLVSLISLPIMTIGMSGNAILRAEGDGMRAMISTLVPGVMALLIDPILIVWLDLGLDGAAIGVGFSRTAMALTALYFVIKKHDLLAYPSVTQISKTIKPYCIVAIPTILTQLSTPFGNYVLTIVIAGFGDSAVAAWAVVNRLTVLSFGGIFSLSSAVGGIFGQNFGAQNFRRLITAYRDGLIFCIGYTSFMWAILIASTDLIVKLFGLDPEGAQIIWNFTHFTPGAFIFSGMMFVACSAFNNTGKPIWSTTINWVRDGIFTLPAALWLSGLFNAPSGVLYAQGVAAILAGTIAVIWAKIYIQRLSILEKS
jgi:putative MATE family efflux protein